MNLNGTRRRRAFYDGSTTKSVANVQNSHESTIQRLIPALLVLYQPQPTSAFWGKPHVQPLVASATPAGRPIAHRQRGRRATPGPPPRVIRVPSDQTLSLRAGGAGGAAVAHVLASPPFAARWRCASSSGRARVSVRRGCSSCSACWTDASRALAAWRSCSRLGLGLGFG